VRAITGGGRFREKSRGSFCDQLNATKSWKCDSHRWVRTHSSVCDKDLALLVTPCLFLLARKVCARQPISNRTSNFYRTMYQKQYRPRDGISHPLTSIRGSGDCQHTFSLPAHTQSRLAPQQEVYIVHSQKRKQQGYTTFLIGFSQHLPDSVVTQSSPNLQKVLASSSKIHVLEKKIVPESLCNRFQSRSTHPVASQMKGPQSHVSFDRSGQLLNLDISKLTITKIQVM